jgi:hypothetical protein
MNNEIPTWQECNDIGNQCAADLTPLERFILDNEPDQVGGEEMFREQLQAVVDDLTHPPNQEQPTDDSQSSSE